MSIPKALSLKNLPSTPQYAGKDAKNYYFDTVSKTIKEKDASFEKNKLSHLLEKNGPKVNCDGKYVASREYAYPLLDKANEIAVNPFTGAFIDEAHDPISRENFKSPHLHGEDAEEVFADFWDGKIIISCGHILGINDIPSLQSPVCPLCKDPIDLDSLNPKPLIASDKFSYLSTALCISSFVIGYLALVTAALPAFSALFGKIFLVGMTSSLFAYALKTSNNVAAETAPLTKKQKMKHIAKLVVLVALPVFFTSYALGLSTLFALIPTALSVAAIVSYYIANKRHYFLQNDPQV